MGKLVLEHRSGEFAKGAKKEASRISGVMQWCEMPLSAEKRGSSGPLSRMLE